MYSAERGGGIAVGSVLGQPALLCELLQQKRKEKKAIFFKSFLPLCTPEKQHLVSETENPKPILVKTKKKC